MPCGYILPRWNRQKIKSRYEYSIHADISFPKSNLWQRRVHVHFRSQTLRVFQRQFIPTLAISVPRRYYPSQWDTGISHIPCSDENQGYLTNNSGLKFEFPCQGVRVPRPGSTLWISHHLIGPYSAAAGTSLLPEQGRFQVGHVRCKQIPPHATWCVTSGNLQQASNSPTFLHPKLWGSDTPPDCCGHFFAVPVTFDCIGEQCPARDKSSLPSQMPR